MTRQSGRTVEAIRWLDAPPFRGPAPAEYLSRHPDVYVIAVRLPLRPADMPRRPDGSVDIEAFPEQIFGPGHVKRHPDGSAEYIGIPESHPASFRRFLKERLINKTGIVQHHLLNGEVDPTQEVRDVGSALRSAPVDVAFVGIGENGHLAFNDPPADFETEEPYIIVALDEACRRQQLGEGWFATLEDVPRRAISMSIRQILKAKEIICFVPDARKAKAVKACFEGEISSQAPASILRTHKNTTVYLDKESAALLSPATLASAS